MLSSVTRNWWVFALRGTFAVVFGVAAFAWPAIVLASDSACVRLRRDYGVVGHGFRCRGEVVVGGHDAVSIPFHVGAREGRSLRRAGD